MFLLNKIIYAFLISKIVVPSLISNCRHFSPGYQNIFLTQENTSAVIDGDIIDCKKQQKGVHNLTNSCQRKSNLNGVTDVATDLVH